MLGTGFKGLSNLIKSNDLIFVNDLQDGDILGIATEGNGQINHTGIFLKGEILHQYVLCASVREAYSQHWRSQTIVKLRHKSRI